ncbi:brorin-like isoform X2 [Ruditapes philippinarum]|nr:brorin-like isoform X2 [Ruditapes philippinarum]
MSWTLIFKVTCALICVLCFSPTYVRAKDYTGIKRFLHGCPFAFPCPPPPCDNPVYGPHDCCGSCPEPTTAEPMTLKVREEKAVHPQVNPAKKTRRGHFFKKMTSEITSHELRNRQFTTTTYPTTSECPYPCVHHGYHYCYPLPCYIPCVDGVKGPRDCCYQCPNGPNCMHDDKIIPEGKNVTLPSGDVAYCSNGGLYGGSVHVYPVLG